MKYLEITREQASALCKDVQVFSNFGNWSSDIKAGWWTPEMCREPSHSYRDPIHNPYGERYKWYIVVSDDDLS